MSQDGRATHSSWAMGLVAPAICAVAVPAQAHVKWFTTTDVHTAPVALATVLSPVFWAVLGLFCLLVFLGFLLDGWVARRFAGAISSGMAHAGTEQRLIRAATGGYLLYISSVGAVLLTPELRTHDSWPEVVQFLSALFLLWQPTAMLSGVGLLALYGAAIARFGIFHLTDYVFVPCLALYLMSLSASPVRLVRFREPMLIAGLAFSLAWTAIEKFLYPQWTDAVVATHPSIGLGLPLGFVVVMAAFIEFTLAFYLMTGRGLLRLGGLGYALIFVAAMPAFGRLDVFGHLTILAVLGVVVLRGSTPMQDGLHLWRAGPLRVGTLHPVRALAADSAWILLLYLGALIAFFAGYYALQRS